MQSPVATATRDRFGDTSRAEELPNKKKVPCLIVGARETEDSQFKLRFCAVEPGKAHHLAGCFGTINYAKETQIKWLACLVKAAHIPDPKKNDGSFIDPDKGSWGVEGQQLLGRCVMVEIEHSPGKTDATKTFVGPRYGNYEPWEPEGDALAVVEQWRAEHMSAAAAGGSGGETVGAGAPAAASAGLPF